MLSKKIADRFSRAANTYDQYSYPQQIIGERLIEKIISQQLHFDTVMDLGCGTGLTTLKLVQRLGIGNGVASDISVPLLNMAKEKLTRTSFQVRQFDFDRWVRDELHFDLIFSNMALHWSEDFERLLSNIYRSLKQNALLAFSLPIDGTFIEISDNHRNQFITLDDANQLLLHAGFKLLLSHEESFSFKFPTWFKALLSIKATGATTLTRHSNSYIRKSDFLNEVISHPAMQPKLTYRVGFFLARKGI